MLLWTLTVVFITIIISVSSEELDKDDHDRIKMGVAVHSCDDGKFGIEMDWANKTNYEYTCLSNETTIKASNIKPSGYCRTDGKRKKFPGHQCLTEKIEYDEKIPNWGNHRPLWPTYGEYLYLPPQRWLHSTEHKGTVFLYHPCADPKEVEKLRNFARSCFYRWVMTPNRNLDEEYPFAVVTFGCTYKMANIDEVTLKAYLKDHSLKDGLEIVYGDGSYDFALLRASYPKDLTLVRNEKICNDNDDDVKRENNLLDSVHSVGRKKVNSNIKIIYRKRT